MNDDLLERLAEIEVAPPPAEFDRQLHDRLNRVLLVQQLIDAVFGLIPWTVAHFLRTVAGFAAFTVTGRWADERQKKNVDSL